MSTASRSDDRLQFSTVKESETVFYSSDNALVVVMSGDRKHQSNPYAAISSDGKDIPHSKHYRVEWGEAVASHYAEAASLETAQCLTQ